MYFVESYVRINMFQTFDLENFIINLKMDVPFRVNVEYNQTASMLVLSFNREQNSDEVIHLEVYFNGQPDERISKNNFKYGKKG